MVLPTVLLRVAGSHSFVSPPEISLDFNNVGVRDMLLHFRAIGRGRRGFYTSEDFGSEDRGRRWEPTLAADFLLHAAWSFSMGPDSMMTPHVETGCLNRYQPK